MLFQVDAMAVTGPGLCAFVWKTVFNVCQLSTDSMPSVCPTRGRYLQVIIACWRGPCGPSWPSLVLTPTGSCPSRLGCHCGTARLHAGAPSPSWQTRCWGL